jgi:hypothetical protein
MSNYTQCARCAEYAEQVVSLQAEVARRDLIDGLNLDAYNTLRAENAKLTNSLLHVADKCMGLQAEVARLTDALSAAVLPATPGA